MSVGTSLVDTLPILLKRVDSQSIVSITGSNGARSHDTKIISKEFALFYSKLEQPINAPALTHIYFSDLRLPKVTEDQKLQLNAPITRDETALLCLTWLSGLTCFIHWRNLVWVTVLLSGLKFFIKLQQGQF